MPRPVFLHQLDEMTRRGCDTPFCTHEHGAELYLTPRCHPGVGVRVGASSHMQLSNIQRLSLALHAQHAQDHPAFPFIDTLPGAGAVFAPRLLVAFGEQRDRYASAAELQKYAGIAPVTERSGKKSWGHWRLQCPKFLRHTFVEWAAESIRHAFWAQVYYQQQRDKGKAHQAAVHPSCITWRREPKKL